MKWLVSLLLVVAVARGAEDNDSLKGSKIYKVHPATDGQFNDVRSLADHGNDVAILQYANIHGREGKILVKANMLDAFEARMKSAGIPFEVDVEDVWKAIEMEREENERAKEIANKQGKTIDFTYYPRHDQINAYLEDLREKYPELVTVVTQKTTEGRDLKAIIISRTGGTDSKKPVIIADAGIHAREWIAPATALYMIHKLVENVTENDVANDIDWVIVPVLNPDGYEYSHEKYRMWRKTRSKTSNPDCFGVDGNRNFDFQWMIAGSSDKPCQDQYAGPKAFSEPETGLIRDLLAKYKGRTGAYTAIHSYGRYILYPYGYNGSPTPDDAALQSVGQQMAAAIEKASLPGSQKYTVGNSGLVLYKVGGTSDDYAYEKGGARLSYTIELPGPGFDLPPSKITQTVQETWQGIIVLGKNVIAMS